LNSFHKNHVRKIKGHKGALGTEATLQSDKGPIALLSAKNSYFMSTSSWAKSSHMSWHAESSLSLVQRATQVMTLASVRSTWKQGSWVLWSTVFLLRPRKPIGAREKAANDVTSKIQIVCPCREVSVLRDSGSRAEQKRCEAYGTNPMHAFVYSWKDELRVNLLVRKPDEMFVGLGWVLHPQGKSHRFPRFSLCVAQLPLGFIAPLPNSQTAPRCHKGNDIYRLKRRMRAYRKIIWNLAVKFIHDVKVTDFMTSEKYSGILM